MCGIIGAVAENNIAKILIDGLSRLEYRGYDSAGIAVIDNRSQLQRLRTVGKVQELRKLFDKCPIDGNIGIAHTRWATHGKPSEQNAHPHVVNNEIALVHNGIIENHEHLRTFVIKEGCSVTSETDSELIAHLLYLQLKSGDTYLQAMFSVMKKLEGAYALGILLSKENKHLLAARKGSPLIIGLGENCNYISSDTLALLPLVNKFIYLEDGDVADITKDNVSIYDSKGGKVTRTIHSTNILSNEISKGNHPHFMLKEILEQPASLAKTLEGRILNQRILPEAFGVGAPKILKDICRIKLVACGTSYHAALIGKCWLESLANIPCDVEIASEYRYRKQIIEPNTLFLTLSQSGETADTLAALRLAKHSEYAANLCICNTPESSMVRESQLVFLIHAGVEIGVASTKSFICQLAALLMLALVLRHFKKFDTDLEAMLVSQLIALPLLLEKTLSLKQTIEEKAKSIADKHSAIFLGRGILFPIAMEGALKLKEISYVHAEAFPAGELKHGPLALVNSEIPIIALAENSPLTEKLKSNLEEVMARHGNIILFSDDRVTVDEKPGMQVIALPGVDPLLSPFIQTIPMQLLAYYVAAIKGTDIDHPRNLAKSVTVE